MDNNRKVNNIEIENVIRLPNVANNLIQYHNEVEVRRMVEKYLQEDTVQLSCGITTPRQISYCIIQRVAYH